MWMQLTACQLLFKHFQSTSNAFPVCWLISTIQTMVWLSTLTQSGIPSSHEGMSPHELQLLLLRISSLEAGRLWIFLSLLCYMYIYIYICMYYTVMIEWAFDRPIHKTLFFLLECFLLFCIIRVGQRDNRDPELSVLDTVHEFPPCSCCAPGERKAVIKVWTLVWRAEVKLGRNKMILD